MLYVLIAILVAADQFFKYLVTLNLSDYQVYPVINGFFSITHFANTGGAFSFLAEKDWGIILLTAISVIVSVILLYALYKLKNRGVFWTRFAIAILASGTIGNMIDRVRYHSVVDFMMFTFGSYTFPIFNLADMCIVCGSILLAILLLFDKKLFRPSNAKKTDSHPDNADEIEGKSSENDS
jgi:signal peptidase II